MKKQHMFKATAILLLFVMLLVGCSTKQNEGTTIETTSTETGKTDSNDTTMDSKTDATANTTGAVTEAMDLEPLELNVVLVGTEQKDIGIVQEKISALTKEKINATVKITTIPFSSWTQQTSLMLASGEQIDLLWTSSFFNYTNNVASGQLYALDDLLKNYGQGVTDSMDSRFIDACRVNGEIFGIPAIRDFAQNYGIIMRKDIVEKYNIDVTGIKEPADLTKIFEIVAANEPDLNCFMTANPNTYSEIFGQTKYDKLGDWLGVVELTDKNYKVMNWYETDYYKSLLMTVRDWYEKGYISKDAATLTETPEALVKANKLFAFSYNGKPGIELQESQKCGTEMIFVPVSNQISTTGTITNGMISVPITAADPERSMMLMNLWYTDDQLVNYFDNGIEGVHYVKSSDGLLTYPEGIDASNATYVPITWRIGNNFLAGIWNGNDASIWDQMKDFNNNAQASVALGFTFNSEPVKTEIAAVTNVISGYQMAFETGTLDVESVLPEYQEKLKAAGLDKIIQEKQTQLDAWVKANQ